MVLNNHYTLRLWMGYGSGEQRLTEQTRNHKDNELPPGPNDRIRWR
jgi:hypothetical protein